MRMFFGRLLYRLGLRLCGVSPAHTVTFTSRGFTPERIKAFVGQAVLLVEGPHPLDVGIPREAWDVAAESARLPAPTAWDVAADAIVPAPQQG